MFKFYRDGSERSGREVIGHERFCQHRTCGVSSRRRKINLRKKPLPSSDISLELLCSGPGVLNSGENENNTDEWGFQSTPLFCRSNIELNLKNPNRLKYGQKSYSSAILRTKIVQEKPENSTNNHTSVVDDNKEHATETSSWIHFIRLISSIATIFSCRQVRKTSIKYDPNSDMGSNSVEFEYSRLGESSVNFIEFDETYFTISRGIIQLERGAGLRICIKYLESTRGRYELIDRLPDIGWRSNRLWYVVCDTRVRAERILSVTPCNAMGPIFNSSINISTIVQACQALQHPYVCPILDLEVIDADAFGKKFIVAVTPLVARGSLRDIYHRSVWSDHWDNKYNLKRGGVRSSGFSEVQAQRLSCHILAALIELRVRGLPPGIGHHLHSRNILLQNGTARFSGLENILFSYQPRNLPFITTEISRNLESLDSISFAYILFSLCSGYELLSSELTEANWNDVKDYANVLEVLEFVLKNKENRIPTLFEISQLDFYRTLDLRELRAPPPSSNLVTASEKSESPLKKLLENFKSNKSSKRGKSKSICEFKMSRIGTSKENDDLAQFKLSHHIPNKYTKLSKGSYSFSSPCLFEFLDEVSNENSIESLKNSENTSLKSVYWTPPNSITFINPSSLTKNMPERKHST